jgi:ABC-type uncharacterized transport system, periplasmic component
MMATELYPKRLQLLKDVNPQLTRAAVLWNPDHPFHVKAVESLKTIAPSLSIELSSAAVRTSEQFAPAISSIIQEKVQALYVVEDPISLLITRLFWNWRRRPDSQPSTN